MTIIVTENKIEFLPTTPFEKEQLKRLASHSINRESFDCDDASLDASLDDIEYPTEDELWGIQTKTNKRSNK